MNSLKRQKILRVIIASAMIVNIAATTFVASADTGVAVFAEKTDADVQFKYSILDDGTIEITGYEGDSTEVVIPSEIDGYTVTSIGYYAFYNCNSLINIEIPNSVTSIGERAFYSCSSLTSVTIPDSVTNIGVHAFEATEILQSQKGVKYIDKWVVGCDGDITEVNIKNGTVGISGSAFDDCYNLTSITIPNSVTSIGDYAFSGCYSLTSITIPDSVTSIGDYAFSGCYSLTSITIPDSVTSIGDYAFSGCSSLTNITIPNSVTSIREGVFCNCDNLTSITIPNSVTSIGDYVFMYCDSLTVTILNSATSIKDNAFLYSGVTIYGYKGSTAETYANENYITFVAITPIKITNIKVFDDDIKVGGKVKLGVDKAGEASNIKYKFEYTRTGKNWSTIQDYSTSRYLTWTPKYAGTYTIRVTATDGINTDVKTINVVVSENSKPLEITSLKTFNDSIKVGDSVKLGVQSTGGSGTIKYTYQYTRTGKNYVTIAENTTSRYPTFTPKYAGTYTIKVTATDGTQTVTKEIKIVVA